MSNLHAFAGTLNSAVTDRGRYEAKSLGRLLSWSDEEMAKYLGVSVETVRQGTDAAKHQGKLADLAALLVETLEAFYGIPPRDAPANLTHRAPDLNEARQRAVTRALALSVAWLNTNQRVLGAVPKQLILDGRLQVVRDLVHEVHEDDGR